MSHDTRFTTPLHSTHFGYFLFRCLFLSSSLFFLYSFALVSYSSALLFFSFAFDKYMFACQTTLHWHRKFCTIYRVTYLKIHMYTIFGSQAHRSQRVEVRVRETMWDVNIRTHTGILFSMGNTRNDSWKRESNLRLNSCPTCMWHTYVLASFGIIKHPTNKHNKKKKQNDTMTKEQSRLKEKGIKMENIIWEQDVSNIFGKCIASELSVRRYTWKNTTWYTRLKIVCIVSHHQIQWRMFLLKRMKKKRSSVLFDLQDIKLSGVSPRMTIKWSIAKSYLKS